MNVCVNTQFQKFIPLKRLDMSRKIQFNDSIVIDLFQSKFMPFNILAPNITDIISRLYNKFTNKTLSTMQQQKKRSEIKQNSATT